MVPESQMYYRVERVHVVDGDGRIVSRRDTRPYLVPAGNSRAAALAYITNERHQLIGAISDLAGDKAMATVSTDGRLYVIFVERAAEAVAGDRRPDARDLR